MSSNNLFTLVKLDNESDDTRFVVRSFSDKPEKGELFLAGMLVAQEMINALTKIGIATGTKTCDRLKLLGIKTVDEQNELVTYHSKKIRNIIR